MKYYITQQGLDFVNEVSPEMVKKVASSRVAREKYNVDRAAQKTGSATTQKSNPGYPGISSTGTGPSRADPEGGAVEVAKRKLWKKQHQATRVLDKVSARKIRGV